MPRKSKAGTDSETSSSITSSVSTRLRSANRKGTHNDTPKSTPTKESAKKKSQELSLSERASTEKSVPEETLNSKSVVEKVDDMLETETSVSTTTKYISELQEVNKRTLKEVAEQEKVTGKISESSSDDDAAPEEVSMNTSKVHELDAQKRKRAITQRLVEEKKQRRRQLDLKYKEQRNRKLEELEKNVQVDALFGDQFDSSRRKELEVEVQVITPSDELPTPLPQKILENLEIEERRNASRPSNVTKESNIRNSEPPRKKKRKKDNDTGPFTVVVIDRDQPNAISREVVEFRENHFYGDRLPRKNAILNASQARNGAALRFRRR
ncbi:6468_t:CDS:2 [Acaulospora colombiana]|uniref:6468_t:CDS:1 n=1 Tax=Acaulospora colombiana TaxID=27376 RepID=A0ACA9L6C0_9GLOM|nr:6468_t:CDS:2 [Acaulospora colombiana]